MRLHASVIPDSRITGIADLGPGPDFGQGPGRRMVLLDLELDGVPYSAMDGGSDFLAGGGRQGPCGWLTDLDAMLQMQRIDIAALKRAHAGQGTATPRT
ncbi:MAG: hypothetical protein FJ028_03940 [Chloroflexi bacterium]|nr:hypothetical protein [Chloroflexota bacterium]